MKELILLLFLFFATLISTDSNAKVVTESKIRGNMAAQNNCCDGTCCDSAQEDCCPDPDQGGICCIIASSYCCPPNANFYSRCCPRWMVCCVGGRFGCCDPGEDRADEETAYALFDVSNWDDTTTFYGLTIDTTTASKTQQVVTGFNDYGESTRVFLFDPDAILFYLLRANFTTPGFDGTEPINFYTVDPVKGTTSHVLVRGASGLVTGMAYNSNLQLIQFATYKWVNKQQVGYNFYTIEPNGNGVAKLVSTNDFGTQDNWVGWFHEVSDDGNTIYRLGYKDVVLGINPGVGLTDISTPQATTTWNNVTVPNDLAFYLSINVDGKDFYSLAEDSSGSLNLVTWNLAGNADVIANLGDAYNTRYFGPIAESLNQDSSKYYALVIYEGIIPIETDRWALAVVDIETRDAKTTPLSPWMIAGSDGLSGFGIVSPGPPKKVL